MNTDFLLGFGAGKAAGGSGGPSIAVEALAVTENGTYAAPSGKAYSPITVNVPSGGGDTSNLVIGTFTGTTAGPMDIDLPYTGSGYPIAVLIYPSNGAYNSGSTFYNLVEQYATNIFCAVKSYANLSPSYTGGVSDGNAAFAINVYKASSSKATTYSSSAGNQPDMLGGSAATSSGYLTIVRFKGKTTMSVAVQGTYGFAANIEYTYYVIYSE